MAGLLEIATLGWNTQAIKNRRKSQTEFLLKRLPRIQISGQTLPSTGLCVLAVKIRATQLTFSKTKAYSGHPPTQ